MSWTLADPKCFKLTPGGAWEEYATIAQRTHHVSWLTPTGEILLMGGRDPWVFTTGKRQPGFKIRLKNIPWCALEYSTDS